MKDPIDVPAMEDHEAKLERALVDEFLRLRGYTREQLPALAEDLRAELWAQARAHAAGKLAEIAARAHYTKEIHRDH